MIFGGLVKQSLVDYPGEIAAVLFTRGCNLRCPFCHNAHLLVKPGSVDPGGSISTGEVMAYLGERNKLLDAVVISGGEPTLYAELPDLLREIKDLGYLIKLDTNGTNPVMLAGMMRNDLLDYVAMDLKAPVIFKAYQQACSKLSPEDFFNIRASINLLRNSSIKVEFRTTVIPCLHRPEDIVEIARYIEGAPLYTLQQFNPEYTLEAGYGNEVPYNKQEMAALAEQVAPLVKQVRVVNI